MLNPLLQRVKSQGERGQTSSNYVVTIITNMIIIQNYTLLDTSSPLGNAFLFCWCYCATPNCIQEYKYIYGYEWVLLVFLITFQHHLFFLQNSPWSHTYTTNKGTQLLHLVTHQWKYCVDFNSIVVVSQGSKDIPR